MPYRIDEDDGGFKVTSPHGVKSKHTSLEKARSQKRLLDAVEHGWTPGGKKKRKKRTTGHAVQVSGL
jgi:hypothetical protein